MSDLAPHGYGLRAGALSGGVVHAAVEPWKYSRAEDGQRVAASSAACGAELGAKVNAGHGAACPMCRYELGRALTQQRYGR